MKLKNKRTGEIGEPTTVRHDGTVFVVLKLGEPYCKEAVLGRYRTLAELNSEWEDYEEPKAYYYYIDNADSVMITTDCGFRIDERREELGNYFKAKVEAEQAVERLKAWKRLKDKGLRFTFAPNVGSLDIRPDKFQIEITAEMPAEWFCCDAVQEDLNLLFSGGEE